VGFRWLLASSWASNLGDGIALAAGPLLVASLTHDAFLVALAATVQWIGGVLAQHVGVTAPFWFAFAGSAVFVVVIWRQLAHIAHADEEIAPLEDRTPGCTRGPASGPGPGGGRSAP
jgi:hypothetical protein